MINHLHYLLGSPWSHVLPKLRGYFQQVLVNKCCHNHSTLLENKALQFEATHKKVVGFCGLSLTQIILLLLLH